VWLLAVPAVCVVFGSLANMVVMAANGGQMPVLWPAGCTADSFSSDSLHVCMTEDTNLKFLADWIVLKWGVASPGDFGIWTYELIKVPFLSAWSALVIRKAVRSR